MMPRTEPNALPDLWSSWSEWRDTYNTYVNEFLATRQTALDVHRLETNLRRLGFSGVDLHSEVEYIKASD